MADEANHSTRQQILEAVITCVEKYGIDTLTTRKIADEAGTNVAAINYYFRSKDRLVDEALSMTTHNGLVDIEAIIDQPDQSFAQILEAVCFYYVEGGLRFPGTTLAHVYAMLVEKRYDTPAAGMFQQVFSRLAARAAAAYPDRPQEDIRAALTQTISAVLLSVLAPGLFVALIPLDISTPEGGRMLARYLTHVFETSLEAGLSIHQG